jgi:digeranylgeranylglycerophospholipid reductase
MKEAYDVVVVGCGMAGAAAALTALREDMKVCIIERKKKEFIGKKICGELMPRETLDWLRDEFDICISHYPLKGLEICTSAEHKEANWSAVGCRLRIEEPLCTIDRWQFGQTMVTELQKRGADIVHEKVKGPIYETATKGVKTENSHEYRGIVTIDCSGVFSILRTKILGKRNSGDLSGKELFGIAYKEELVLEEPPNREYAMLLFDRNVVPSGYMWCFPKSEYELNTGMGGLVRDQAFLRGVLDAVLKTHNAFKIREIHHRGIGVLPLGKPLPSAVYPGLLVCGDAAFQVNPLTGEGIAPALTAGYLAGKVAVKAVQNKDTSIKGMWQYNVDFARRYGVIHYPLFVLRDFMLSLSAEEMAFILENMITSEDLAQLEEDGPAPTWGRKLSVLLSSWRKPTLLYRAYVVLRKMLEIRKLLESYPELPRYLPLWQHKLNSYF